MEGSLGRGGSRNREKQCRLDDLCVQATVEQHCLEQGCYFGLYESVARSQAVVGKGLLQNRQLLLSLLNLYPPLDFLMSSLKKGFTRAVLQKPTLNTGQYANNIWAGFRAERVLTLCNHLRRIAREPLRFQQCISKMTPAEVEQLKEVVEKVQLAPGVANSSASDSSVVASPGPATASQGHSPACGSKDHFSGSAGVLTPASGSGGYSPAVPKRQLKKEDSCLSTVTLDSDGFPQMLAHGPPEELPGEDDGQEEVQPLDALMPFSDDYLEKSALSFSGIKATLKRPAAALGSSSGTCTGKKARQVVSSSVAVSPVSLERQLEVPGHAPLRLTYGKDQSYFHWGDEFMCAVSASMAKNHSSGQGHGELCLQVARLFAQSSSPSKEVALAMRKHVLSEAGEF